MVTYSSYCTVCPSPRVVFERTLFGGERRFVKNTAKQLKREERHESCGTSAAALPSREKGGMLRWFAWHGNFI